MKKFLLICTILFLAATSSATFKALEFKANDGSVTIVRTEGLVLTPQGNHLNIANASGEQLSLLLTSIDYMQFTDYSDDPAAVNSITFDFEGKVGAFSLNGIFEGEFPSAFEASAKLKPGIYVLKNNCGKSVKIIVKK